MLDKKSIQKEIEKAWPEAKKNLNKINKDVTKLMKSTEKNLTEVYSKVRENTEQLILKAKREEAYHRLGQAMASRLTKEQLKNKKIAKIFQEIKDINKKLK